MIYENIYMYTINNIVEYMLFDSLFDVLSSLFLYGKALKAKDELHKYIEDTINLGNLDQTTILGMMIEHKRDSGSDITTQHIKESILELLFAGHEGLSSASTSLVAVLSRDKDVRSKLMEEMRLNGFMDKNCDITFECIGKMGYLSGVIKEVLRMYPPIGGVFRSAKSCFKLGVRHS